MELGARAPGHHVGPELHPGQRVATGHSLTGAGTIGADNARHTGLRGHREATHESTPVRIQAGSEGDLDPKDGGQMVR